MHGMFVADLPTQNIRAFPFGGTRQPCRPRWTTAERRQSRRRRNPTAGGGFSCANTWRRRPRKPGLRRRPLMETTTPSWRRCSRPFERKHRFSPWARECHCAWDSGPTTREPGVCHDREARVRSIGAWLVLTIQRLAFDGHVTHQRFCTFLIFSPLPRPPASLACERPPSSLRLNKTGNASVFARKPRPSRRPPKPPSGNAAPHARRKHERLARLTPPPLSRSPRKLTAESPMKNWRLGLPRRLGERRQRRRR